MLPTRQQHAARVFHDGRAFYQAGRRRVDPCTGDDGGISSVREETDSVPVQHLTVVNDGRTVLQWGRVTGGDGAADHAGGVVHHVARVVNATGE